MPSREPAQLGVSGLGVTWQREAREGEVRGCFALGVVHVNSRESREGPDGFCIVDMCALRRRVVRGHVR